MRTSRSIVSIFAAVALLATSGCVTDSGRQVGPNEQFGTVGGMVAGGLIGNQFGKGKGKTWATIGGVLLGGLAGNSIGKAYDEADRRALQENTHRAMYAPMNQPIVWDNPNNGNRVVVTPTREGYTSSGQVCREYQQTVIIGGEQQSAYGTACRQSDGSWKIVK